MGKPREPAALKPHWPDGVAADTTYTVPCDDKGRNGGAWLKLRIDTQGDVWLTMQDWEDVPDGSPSPFPGIRIRTMAGGGRFIRTRQALLWLADAIRRDRAELELDNGHNR